MTSTLRPPADEDWPTEIVEARAVQESLRDRVIREDRLPAVRSVAGVDASYRRSEGTMRAAVACLTFPELDPLEYAVAPRPDTLSLRAWLSLLPRNASCAGGSVEAPRHARPAPVRRPRPRASAPLRPGLAPGCARRSADDRGRKVAPGRNARRAVPRARSLGPPPRRWRGDRGGAAHACESESRVRLDRPPHQPRDRDRVRAWLRASLPPAGANPSRGPRRRLAGVEARAHERGNHGPDLAHHPVAWTPVPGSVRQAAGKPHGIGRSGRWVLAQPGRSRDEGESPEAAGTWIPVTACSRSALAVAAPWKPCTSSFPPVSRQESRSRTRWSRRRGFAFGARSQRGGSR